jgi:hypothetical protein
MDIFLAIKNKATGKTTNWFIKYYFCIWMSGKGQFTFRLSTKEKGMI